MERRKEHYSQNREKEKQKERRIKENQVGQIKIIFQFLPWYWNRQWWGRWGKRGGKSVSWRFGVTIWNCSTSLWGYCSKITWVLFGIDLSYGRFGWTWWYRRIGLGGRWGAKEEKKMIV